MTIELKYNKKDFRIEIDGMQYTAIKVGKQAGGKNKGQETTTVLGHFVKLPFAVDKIIKSELGSLEETVTLQEFVDRVEAAKKEIFDQLDV